MSVIGSNILAGASGQAAGDYTIERSLRFSEEDQAYLNRTPSSAGNRKTYTLSFWVKKSKIGDEMFIFAAKSGSTARDGFRFETGNTFRVFFDSANDGDLVTSQVFRDPSAWYHFVIAVDTTQSTAANRVKIYANGTQIEDFSTETYPVQNYTGEVNNTDVHRIGADTNNLSNTLEGYLADVHLIDGQALAASSFGEYDDNNVWQPKKYSGSYGTNGFHLDFADNSSATALGYDAAGSNNWTVNGIHGGDSFVDYTGKLSTNVTINSGQKSNSFDGDTSTDVYGEHPNSGYFLLSGISIAYSSSVEVYWKSGRPSATFELNGSSVSGLSSGQWNTIATGSGTLTSLKVSRGGDSWFFSAVRVDGTILVNNDADSTIDTPTSYEADSGNNGGNYATLNPLDSSGSTTITNGNLDETTSASGHHMASSTIAVTSGKWYVEFTISSLGGTYSHVGITPINTSNSTYVGNNGYGYTHAGTKQGLNASSASYGDSYAAGDCIGIAFDADNGNLYFYKNGVAQYSGTAAFTGIDTSKHWRFSISHFNGGGAVANFGQRPFAISSVPTGYVSLCTANLNESAYASIPDGSTAFDAITYEGTGSNRSITGLNMSPDFLWIKARTSYQGGNPDHALFDNVRGTGKQLRSNTDGAETSNNYGVTAFNSDGFSLHGSFSGPTNGSHSGTATEYVAWAWDAGDDANPTSISTGSSNSSFYDQSQTWSTYGSASSGGYASGLGIERGFNGDLSTQVEGDTTGAYFSIPFSTTIASGDVGFVSYASSGDGRMKLYNGSSEVDDVGSSGNSQFRYSTYAGAITEIRISRNGRAFEFAAVSVFGKILVDSNQTPPDKPSIASSLRANQSTGFSIISYTGNGTSGATVGHGLNKRPDFIIAKSRDTQQNWIVFHSSFGASYHSDLNLTGGFFSGGSKWTSTEPTSSMFSIASDGAINASSTDYIAYAWTAVEGYSAFGSYTGNGSSDGTFVYTGFKVKFLIIKQDGTNGWFMWDTKRDSLNPNTALFSANASNTEQSQANHAIDFLSNGFKTRDSNGAFNGSGNDYVYIAFAENPFKTARAR
jgi:hypothetical protein